MKSIRHQLTRQLLVSLVGLMGAGLTGLYFGVRHELVEAFDVALRARALAVAALTEIEQGRVQFDFSPGFLATYSAEHPRHFFEVRDARGAALARSPSLQDSDLPWRDGGTARRPSYYDVILPNGRPGRVVALIFLPEENPATVSPPATPVQIIEASDRAELAENLGALLAAIASCGVLLTGAVFWIVPRVLERGLSPLETLGGQAEKIDADSLATRFSSDALPEELQPISRRLNDLLARLEASFERERRFSADLAHELRTPLAELRSLAECALKWPDSRDPQTDREVLAVALQMESLVTRMLTLARGEHGQIAIRLAPTDLAHVVRETWAAHASGAGARGLTVAFDLHPASIPADPVLLRSILSNLIANACDYAPAGSRISITGKWTDHGYTLDISNPAGAVVERDVAQFFDRFWRKEAARSGGEHAGLGLNLARTFAAAMDWSLTARIDDAGWIAVTLTAPSPAP